MKSKIFIAISTFLVLVLVFMGTFMLIKSNELYEDTVSGTVVSEISGDAQYDSEAREAHVQAVQVDYTEGSPVPQPELYIVKAHKGKLCVYSNEFKGAPVIVTDIEVDNLTTLDRELLFQGIEVYGREQLLRILEDYNS